MCLRNSLVVLLFIQFAVFTMAFGAEGGTDIPLTTSPIMEDVSSFEYRTEHSKKVYDTDKKGLKQPFGKFPLYFIENQGQLDEEVAFYVKGKDKTFYFTDTGVTFSLHDENKRWNVKMDFAGANPSIKPRGQDRQQAIFSFFRGKKKDWKTEITSYSRIVYENLWPGIDLVYYGTVNRIKYDFIVKPGADPHRIRFTLSGATDVVLQETGVLKIRTPLGCIEDEKPTAFQEIDGESIDVQVDYHLDRSSSGDSFTLAFQVSAFNRQKILVIDPVILVYCGYIGGASADGGRGIAVDSQGNSYIAGSTYSTENYGFPVLIGPDLTHNGEKDIYVAKVNATGTSLIYCGYLGGMDVETSPDIAVDKRGNAYVTGYTRSSGGSFPAAVGPDLTFNGYRDAFVAKIESSGTSLVYCGYIGGSDSDVGYGIAVDEEENAYVVGGTCSAGFPVLVGPDLTYNGNGDVFVAKVSATGEKLLYCGYIGGTGMEEEWLGPWHDITVADNLACIFPFSLGKLCQL